MNRPTTSGPVPAFGTLPRLFKLHYLVPAFVILIFGVLCWNLVEVYHRNLIQQEQSILKNEADQAASMLTSEINSRQAMIKGLAAMILSHADSGLPPSEFRSFSEGLRANDPSIRAIEFIPFLGPVLVYPVEGNEAILGRTLNDLRQDKRANVRADVQRAISSRRITLSDPYALSQGGMGVVARLAVYDQDELLGLAVIILNQDNLFGDIPAFTVGQTSARYALQDSNGKVFFGDEQVFHLKPVLATITLPEGVWTLGVAPMQGWESKLLPNLLLAWGISLIVTLLAGFLAFLFINNQTLLRKTVAERTAALQESQQRYAQTFEVINEGVWEWDLTSGKGFASENLYSILGVDKAHLHEFNQWIGLFHPEDVRSLQKQIQKCIQTGKDLNARVRLPRKNGETTYFLIRGRVVEKDDGGKSRRMLGTLSDISEQIHAEQNLRESESKFRAIFNNNHAIMLLIDPETERIIDANPAACAFYGYPHESMVSLSIKDLNTASREEVERAVRDAANQNRTFFHFQHRLATGECRDVEVFSGPISQEGKNYLFSIIHDVTARRQAEKALQENENRLRFALEGANDGLWDVNMKTNEVYMSPRGCQILGYASGELPEVIKVWPQLVHPDDLPETNRRLNDHLAGASDIFEVEQRLHMKSGEWKWVLTRGKLVERDADGQPLRMTGTHTDITLRRLAAEKMNAAQQELKRLLAEADVSRQVLLSMLEDQKVSEEKLSHLNAELESRVRERTLQLETANNELEAFSYSVSHDLRAPLRGIDGWSLALVEDYGDQLDERAHQYLQRVRSETQRMGDLIDDLLRLSRVTRMELTQGRVDLSQQAETITERLTEEYAQNPPEFVIQSGILANGDAQLLEIVMTNLLTNACKFSATQPRPRVEFGQMHQDGSRIFYVRDNGVGFDGANAKKLFRAFQRMHKQTEFPGTGIGLATVKRIISRHGGQVWAEAQKNEGATFYFTLPEVK